MRTGATRLTQMSLTTIGIQGIGDRASAFASTVPQDLTNTTERGQERTSSRYLFWKSPSRISPRQDNRRLQRAAKLRPPGDQAYRIEDGEWKWSIARRTR